MPSYRSALSPQVTSAMQALVNPGHGYVGCAEVLAVLLDGPRARLSELASLPLGKLGQQLCALRYFVVNGATWLRHFAWQHAAQRVRETGPDELRALCSRLVASRARVAEPEALAASLRSAPLTSLA